MMRSVSQPAQFPAGSCGAVGEVSLSDKGSYLLPIPFLARTGNGLHCLNLPRGENCLELL